MLLNSNIGGGVDRNIIAFSWNICWEGILGKTNFGNFSKICTPGLSNPCSQNVIDGIIANSDDVDFILLQEFCRQTHGIAAKNIELTDYPWYGGDDNEFSIKNLRMGMVDDDLVRWESLLDWLELREFNAIISNARREAIVTFYKKNKWDLVFANAGHVSTDLGRPMQFMIFKEKLVNRENRIKHENYYLGVVNIHSGHQKTSEDFASSLDNLIPKRISIPIDRIILLGDTNIGTTGFVKNTKKYIRNMKIKISTGHVLETHDDNLKETCCSTSQSPKYRTFADLAFDSESANFEHLKIHQLSWPNSDHLPIKIKFKKTKIKTIVGGMRTIYETLWE